MTTKNSKPDFIWRGFVARRLYRRALTLKKTFLAITLFALVACAGQPQPKLNSISTLIPFQTNAPLTATPTSLVKDNVVVLKIDYKEPITLTVINSQTGAEENKFVPSAMERASRKFIWDNSFLYEMKDANGVGNGVRQIGLDGKFIADYPFVTRGDPYCCLSLLQSRKSSRIAWAECKFFEGDDSICINTISVAQKDGTSKASWQVSKEKDTSIVELLSWSDDERYLYFNHFSIRSSSSFLGGGNDLWELDLDTGQVRALWKDSFYYYSGISPKHSLIAYVVSPDQKQARNLILQKINTNEKREVLWSDRYSAPIWSYDGIRLLYIDYPRLMTLNINDLTKTVVVENIGDPYFYLRYWLPGNIVFLEETSNRIRSLWRLDLATKSLKKIFAADEWIIAEIK